MPALTIAERLDVLTAALTAAPPPSGGPARRIASDYAKGKTKGGRRVASKAGEKRYGLPIGTPLGQGKAKNEKDAYDRLMSQGTPADIAKATRWMSNGDLALTAKAVFSVKTDNERNQAAQIALVKELADRGIDPHKMGYSGGYVPVNPEPKKDPTVRAAEAAQRKTETAQRQRESAAKKVRTDAERATKDAESDAKKAAKDATTAAEQQARQSLARMIVSGEITEAEARRRLKAG